MHTYNNILLPQFYRYILRFLESVLSCGLCNSKNIIGYQLPPKHIKLCTKKIFVPLTQSQ